MAVAVGVGGTSVGVAVGVAVAVGVGVGAAGIVISESSVSGPLKFIRIVRVPPVSRMMNLSPSPAPKVTLLPVTGVHATSLVAPLTSVLDSVKIVS